MATDGVRYSDFSPLSADDLSGDEKFVGLKNGVNVRLEGDWRGPMADLLRPYLGLGNLASVNGSTVGINLVQLSTPGDASWARVNSDGTVSLRTAAQTLSDLGASSGMSNPMTTAGDIIVGGSGGAPERLGIGSNGQVLTVSGGVPAWVDAGTAANALYKGPWEAQTGQAVPPYWVDYGGGENQVIYSEGLNDGSAWSHVNLEAVTDSGIAAPIVDGKDFGNYFEITADTTNGQHAIRQALASPVPDGKVSFLVRANGYPQISPQMRTSGFGGLSPNPVSLTYDLSTQEIISGTIGPGYAEFNVLPLGAGDFFIEGSWSNKTDLQSLVLYLFDGGFSFAGDGTSGILMTRVQVSQAGARYVKTTDTAVPYTPPKIYELQAPVDAIENEDDPITDGGTLWKEVGSGGSGGASTATAAEQVFTSADQDGSGNIAVSLDASQNTEWQLNFNGSPLPSTSGAYNINIANLPDSIDNVQFFHIRMKRAGRKTVNLSATNESSASLTVSWLEAPEFLSTSGAWDMVTLHRWPANPNVLFASLNDGRV